MRVLICNDMFPAVIDTMTRLLPDDEVRVCRYEQVDQKAPWAEVLIPTMAHLTAETIYSAPDLKLIQQFGVGLEGVDLPAAAERKIPVANVPGSEAPVHAECTAEGGLFLMMACARQFKQVQKTLKAGQWGRPHGEALIDRRALIIGLGAIGSALARRLVALNMTVTAVKAHPDPKISIELGLEKLIGPESLLDEVPKADFVISTVTLTDQTRELLNRNVFSRMKPNAFVINVSRGPVIDEDDLLAALNEGLIAGAGLDVLLSEPPGSDHPLVNHDRVIITPHTAGITEQSISAVGRSVADNIERIKTGRSLKNLA